MRVLVTGATGSIGSAVVPELTGAGHEVVGLARSDASAAPLVTAGAEVHRGSLDDLDGLGAAAAACDGVIHLAFKHEEAFSGDFPAATAADRRAIETLGTALAGSGRPLVIASGLAGHDPGTLATEDDVPDTRSVIGERMLAVRLVRSPASTGVRSSSVRLAPTVHGDGDDGRPAIAALADEAGNALLARDADEGGDEPAVPVASVAPEDAAGHFGWLAGFVALDVVASSALTRERLGWQPTHAGLLDDLEQGHYFREAATR